MSDKYTIQELEKISKHAFESGLYPHKSLGQTFTIGLAGQEIGVAPTLAWKHMTINQGKVTIEAALGSYLVKRSGKYDYRVVEHDETVCDIEFFENGQSVGRSRFSMEDAARAGLAGRAIWKAYPRNLLFARAAMNGFRWYCPEVFGGAVYSAEELENPIGEDGPKDDAKRPVKRLDPVKYTAAKDVPKVLTEEQWAKLQELPTDKLMAAKEKRGAELSEEDQKKLSKLIDERIEAGFKASEPTPEVQPEELSAEAA